MLIWFTNLLYNINKKYTTIYFIYDYISFILKTLNYFIKKEKKYKNLSKKNLFDKI